MPITVKMGRDRVKEEFLKNKNVTDVRAIDMLIVRVSRKKKIRDE